LGEPKRRGKMILQKNSDKYYVKVELFSNSSESGPFAITVCDIVFRNSVELRDQSEIGWLVKACLPSHIER